MADIQHFPHLRKAFHHERIIHATTNNFTIPLNIYFPKIPKFSM